ncbi:MAG: ATP-binding protein [Oscillospiraceae bacterium]
MKIHQLTATFGKLRQQTLSLEDGLNIMEAPNEAGKSTWAGFLRAMLYGIDTKERDKKGVIAEKNRYLPWDGGAMEGSIQLNWAGKEITLRRTSKGNSPLSQFQAVYTGTEEPVPGLNADNVGETLTGVGREVFERSAFVGQSSLAVTGSAELERRICAIVSSGQEDVSYSETEQRLRDWKNRRQSNQKNGLIPRLEEEKASVAATLERLESANRQAAAARARIRELDAERAELEQQAQAHRALANVRIRERYDAAKADLDAAQTAWNAVHQERLRRGTPPDGETLRNMQGELSYLNTLDANIKQARRECEEIKVPSLEIKHPVFAGMDPAAVRERATADAQEVRQFQEDTRGAVPWSVRFIIIGVLLAAAAGVLLIDRFAHANPLYIGILAAVCAVAVCALVVWGVVKHWKGNTRVHRILDSYGVQDAAGIIEQAKQYIADYEAVSQARTDAAVRAVSLERLEAEREELAERLLEAAHTFAPEVTDLYGVSAAVSLALNLGEKEKAAALRLESAEKVLQAVTAQGVPAQAQVPDQVPERSEQEVAARLNAVRLELSRLNETLAMAQGEMNTLGDPAALQARLGELEDQLSRRREEYSALAAAMDGLTEANALLQARMSPALNARAGELLSRLTGGKYDQVSLTREFEALASQRGDVTPRRLLTLSKGTADQLYLAVRLAVCDLVLPGDDAAPLVLDDALVNFDDERLGLALELLRDLAQKRQILLFTCQSRERLRLTGAPDVRITRLQS